MADADIQVTSELLLTREQFKSELRNSVSDVQEAAREISANPIVIPVVANDQITAQVDQIISNLSAREIVIPVRYETIGGGPSEGFDSEAQWPDRINRAALRNRSEYMQFLGRTANDPTPSTYDVNEWTGGGVLSLSPLAGGRAGVGGMSSFEAEANGVDPDRYVPSMATIQGASEGPIEEGGEGAAAGGGRSGFFKGFRAIRGLMAAHLAIKGIEAAYGSYEYGNQMTALAGGEDEGTAEGMREMIADKKRTRGGFYGLTGAGIDAFHAIDKWAGATGGDFWTGDPLAGISSEGLASDEADLRAEKKHQGSIAAGNRLNRGTEAFDDVTKQINDEVAAADSTDTIGKKIADVKRKIDAMGEAADKQAEHLRDDVTKLLPSARPGALKTIETDLAKRQDAIGRLQPGLIREATDDENDREWSEYDRDQSRSEADASRLSGMRASNTALEQRSSGDVLASRMTEIAEQSRKAIESLDTHRITDGMSDADYRAGRSEIDRRQSDEEDIARRDDYMGVQRMQNQIRNAGIVSPFLRRSAEIEEATDEAAERDPTHQSMIRQRGAAEMGALNRDHTRRIQAMEDQATETQLRTEHQPMLADVLGLNHRMEAELAENEGDPQMQSAIRAKYRSMAGSMQEQISHPHHAAQSAQQQYMSTVAAGLNMHGGGANDAQRAMNALNSMQHNIGIGEHRAGMHGGGESAGAGDNWKTTVDKFSQAVDKMAANPLYTAA